MSHGEIHAGAKGENPERGISASLAANEHSPGGGGAVAPACDFTASSLSLPRASRPARWASHGGRARVADYLQNSRQRHPHAARVCRSQRSSLERGCDTRHYAVRGACFSAWLSGVARPRFVLHTPSTVCLAPNCSGSMTFSFPIVYG